MCKRRLVFCSVVTVMIVTVISSGTAFAWGWGRKPSSHDKQYGHHSDIRVLPYDHVRISIGGLPYYYIEGVFYRKGLSGYVMVTPPQGAVVRRLPEGYQMILFGNDIYYYYTAIYYQACKGGYVVVPTPVFSSPQIVIIERSAPTTVKATMPAGRTVVINIPNSKGSFTPVVLRKADNGYIGPQGE